MSSPAEGPGLFEWHATLETEPGRRARAGGTAYRMRFRRHGSERWHRFTLSTAGGGAPTEAEALEAIGAYFAELPEVAR